MGPEDPGPHFGLTSPRHGGTLGFASGGFPDISALRRRIAAGEDPLGEALQANRPAANRRRMGQVLTPPGLVAALLARATAEAVQRGDPTRVVDGGAGSGRFLLAAGRAFPHADLIGVEADPLLALMARANLSAAGLGDRTRIIHADYRTITLDPAPGWSLFIGNPPYVRHHAIAPRWKDWYHAAAAGLGAGKASRLAGLHLHFFVKTGLLARAGDLAILVTAAEWMETGYGRALRRLLTGALGGRSVHRIAADAAPFPGTLTTAAITVFMPGSPATSLRFAEVARVDDLRWPPPGPNVPGDIVPVDIAAAAKRWPPAPRSEPDTGPGTATSGREGPAPAVIGARPATVGDLFRVSRGQVTGMNRVWIAGAGPGLPDRFLYPCVTAAAEVFAARANGGIDPARLRRVIDLPADLSALSPAEADQVGTFLAWARTQGADASYIARHRRPWWRVRLAPPPPIVCTYMARQPPAFARNRAAHLLNIAHGLTPRRPMDAADLDRVAQALNALASLDGGRTYAGGLVKFEPGQIAALPLPGDFASAR